METRPVQTQFRSKRGLLSALVSLTLTLNGLAADSEQYKQTQQRGFKRGKHSGQNNGSFGGPRAAKSHRLLFLHPHLQKTAPAGEGATA